MANETRLTVARKLAMAERAALLAVESVEEAECRALTAAGLAVLEDATGLDLGADDALIARVHEIASQIGDRLIFAVQRFARN